MIASRRARFNSKQIDLPGQTQLKPSIGKIISKNSRHRIEKDQQQQQSVEKRKSVSYGAGSLLNYSQIYKQIKINKQMLPNATEGWLPRMPMSNTNAMSHTNAMSNTNANNTHYTLPAKEVRSGPGFNDSQPQQNSNSNSRSRSKSKSNSIMQHNANTMHKAFSISNYDIYKSPANKLNTIKTENNEEENGNIGHHVNNTTSLLPALNQIKVSFVVEEKDLPELNQSKLTHIQQQQTQPQEMQPSLIGGPSDIQQNTQFQSKKDHGGINNRQTDNNQTDNNQIDSPQFNLQEYGKVQGMLKSMQNILRNSGQLDIQHLMREFKRYLQVIANGGVDNIDAFDLPLVKKKIVKTALINERVSIIIIAFAYATSNISSALKYLINLLSYAMNNSQLLIKVLHISQIKQKERERDKQMQKQKQMQNKQKQMQNDMQVNKQTKQKQPIKDKSALKKCFDTLRNNNDVMLDSILKMSKYDESFCENFKEIMKLSSKSSIEHTFYNVLEYFAFFLCVADLHHMIPFLAVAPNPYLSSSSSYDYSHGTNHNSTPKYTLVIDTVEVFCHGSKKSKTHVFRPHTEHFLYQMSQYYQIISFTNAFPSQIDKVIDFLDPKRCIKHRLYRHHSVQRGNYLIKDVERIGRDMETMILLDSDTNRVVQQANIIPNAIFVPVWRGNRNDTTLAELSPVLAMVALKKLNCCNAVKKIQDQQQKNHSIGVKYFNFGINLD